MKQVTKDLLEHLVVKIETDTGLPNIQDIWPVGVDRKEFEEALIFSLKRTLRTYDKLAKYRAAKAESHLRQVRL